MMDMDWLKRLIHLVESSEIDTLEVSRFGTRVRVSKSPPANGVVASVAAPGLAASVPLPATDEATPAATAGSTETAEPIEAPADDLQEIVSPMVGTFYRAPAPDAPAYVEVGDRVSKGQTLCILEAMKLMNELESEVSGVIREISVQNAEPVEYGQPLFRVQPDG